MSHPWHAGARASNHTSPPPLRGPTSRSTGWQYGRLERHRGREREREEQIEEAREGLRRMDSANLLRSQPRRLCPWLLRASLPRKISILRSSPLASCEDAAMLRDENLFPPLVDHESARGSLQEFDRVQREARMRGGQAEDFGEYKKKAESMISFLLSHPNTVSQVPLAHQPRRPMPPPRPER
uniref:Uncharacterized protein n=1 Tax=Guillardia theta TaxID=55529 RepID=A0A7S4K1K9_GUITH|mmetsp:Transcript_20299/g.67747  ORF Transcript_20299/g.67747 Transcript_20299/m.67747 type:complete len:183 (+) Transcript_20299:227-775(+)